MHGRIVPAPRARGVLATFILFVAEARTDHFSRMWRYNFRGRPSLLLQQTVWADGRGWLQY